MLTFLFPKAIIWVRKPNYKIGSGYQLRKKLYEISYFEIVLCMLVVLIHVLSECLETYRPQSLQAAVSFYVSRSATFCVPAFIISSGIKMFNKFKTERLDYTSFIKSRITKIYFPYALWITVYYLYFVLYAHYFEFSIKSLLYYILLGHIAAPFYFVVVIMQFYLLMPLWLYVCKKLPAMPTVFACIVITVISDLLLKNIPNYDRLFLKYLCYFIIGGQIGLNYNAFLSRLKKHKSAIVITALLFTLIYVTLAYFEYLNIFRSTVTELMKMPFCIFSSLACLSLMPNRESKIVNTLSQTTYYIYLIHCLIVTHINMILTNLGVISVTKRLIIRFAAVYSLSIILTLCYVLLKKHFNKNGSHNIPKYRSLID